MEEVSMDVKEGMKWGRAMTLIDLGKKIITIIGNITEEIIVEIINIMKENIIRVEVEVEVDIEIKVEVEV